MNYFLLTLNSQLHYFEAEDTLHLLIAQDEEQSSVEIAPNITAELNYKVRRHNPVLL